MDPIYEAIELRFDLRHKTVVVAGDRRQRMSAVSTRRFAFDETPKSNDVPFRGSHIDFEFTSECHHKALKRSDG